MELIADLHTHTVASTHAYSTLQEMVDACRKNGQRAMAVTDHAPAMPDAPHEWYFHNLLRLPNWLEDGFLLLRGAEVNGLNPEGGLDLDEGLLSRLDWVIVSLHSPSCIPVLSKQEATRLWLNVAENPYVDMIGHSEQAKHVYDYDLVTKAFAKNHKVVELNANSAITRPGNEENLKRLAVCCLNNGTKIAVNSDAHSTFNLQNRQPVLDMLAEIDFPQELVVNSSMQGLLAELALHGKDMLLRK